MTKLLGDIVKIIYVALLVAVLGLTVNGCDTSSETSSDSVGKPDIKVDAGKILKEYENNEAAADGKYKDKTLEVSGVVAKVDTEMFDDKKYTVEVDGGGKYNLTSVTCHNLSSKDVAKIKKGQKITVVGKFDDGGDLGVDLKPCQVK